jgi:hypothetical protein
MKMVMMNSKQLIDSQIRVFEKSEISEIKPISKNSEKSRTKAKSLDNDSLDLDITQPGREFDDKEILDKNADA